MLCFGDIPGPTLLRQQLEYLHDKHKHPKTVVLPGGLDWSGQPKRLVLR